MFDYKSMSNFFLQLSFIVSINLIMQKSLEMND